ncbi:MAG: glycosyltransferase family 9 protein [Verrucomicrobia bacterium]|nr:glycosyltransferase family 9 protein [Verrucomicrobiota bacterium]
MPPSHAKLTSRNILVIKLGALGDIILAMEAFQAIRRRHANDSITLLTRQPFVSLTEAMPWFDRVWADPAPKLLQVRQWLAFRQQLRGGNFRRVYDLQCNDRAGFYFRLLGPGRPEWCGVARGCSHPRPDFGGEKLPVTERLLRMIEAAGVPRAGAADLTWLDGSLAGFSLPERFVLLVPGCAPQHPYKRWPAAHFAGLVEQLAGQGLAAVAIGTAVDIDAIAEIQALAPAVINLAGQTDLGQVAALARRAEAVVGNDTGPVHITGMVGAPTLVLMSRVTDPVRMLPRGPAVGWLKMDTLADLTADEVFKAIRLRSNPTPACNPPP